MSMILAQLKMVTLKVRILELETERDACRKYPFNTDLQIRAVVLTTVLETLKQELKTAVAAVGDFE